MILTPPGVLASTLKEFQGAPAIAPAVPRREMALANASNNKRLRELVPLAYGPGTHTWTAPLTTLKLESLTGTGGTGEPAVPAELWYSIEKTVTTRDSSGAIISGPTTTYDSADGVAPENGCTETYSSSTGNTTTTCYTYTQYGSSYQPPSTGASTTAFGMAFPGGNGGPASPVAVSANIHVVPGAAYTIVVAPGGSLAFSFYQ